MLCSKVDEKNSYPQCHPKFHRYNSETLFVSTHQSIFKSSDSSVKKGHMVVYWSNILERIEQHTVLQFLKVEINSIQVLMCH